MRVASGPIRSAGRAALLCASRRQTVPTSSHGSRQTPHAIVVVSNVAYAIKFCPPLFFLFSPIFAVFGSFYLFRILPAYLYKPLDAGCCLCYVYSFLGSISSNLPWNAGEVSISGALRPHNPNSFLGRNSAIRSYVRY
jgi:hypothetical protein